MKIALVSQEYPLKSGHGGIGSQTYMKAHGLTARGQQVYVISHSEDDREHVTTDRGVQVRRIPNLDHRLPINNEASRWLTYSTCVAEALARLDAEVQLDIIDFAEWASEGFLHLVNRVPNHGPRTVIQLHGPLVMFAQQIGWPALDSEFYRIGTFMEGTCLRLADAVYSSSRCSVDWCSQHYGLRHADVPILHMGIDLRQFRPNPAARRPDPTIIFVGKIVENKGVEPLVEACLQIAPQIPNLRLRLLGRGDAALMERLQQRVARGGMPQLLEMVGFVPQPQLPQELVQAHVFAAPSIYEGGPGFVYLEAMACGLPVIACAGSGAAEVIAEGVNGLLVPPRDVESLATALYRLLNNTEEREAMGQRGLEYVRAEADCEQCLTRLQALYEGVVAGK